EDGIRDFHVTGVQTCALPIFFRRPGRPLRRRPGQPLGLRGHGHLRAGRAVLPGSPQFRRLLRHVPAAVLLLRRGQCQHHADDPGDLPPSDAPPASAPAAHRAATPKREGVRRRGGLHFCGGRLRCLLHSQGLRHVTRNDRQRRSGALRIHPVLRPVHCAHLVLLHPPRRGGALLTLQQSRGSPGAPPRRKKMSHFIDRLRYLVKRPPAFADGHGETRDEPREREDGYRPRWQYDKIVRSTHGVNCTGSCSWKIYVKNGLITWETQQTDYPRTRPDLPNHEPRGCPRGASYSWYIYSANRLKYPLIRKPLIQLWRAALANHPDPVDAWASIVEDAEKTKRYEHDRGLGGFVRADWDEMQTLIAAANVYTIKQYGPDRVIGFSPIPAMSMVSYAAGTRYLSLIGGVCLSFYDWYCDLPPSSPQTWGEQTDVP